MAELRIAIFTGSYNHIKDGVSLTLNRWVAFLKSRSIPVVVFGPSVKEPVIDHEGEFIPVPSVAAPGRPDYRISTGLHKEALVKLEKFNPTLVHIATPDILGFKALMYAQDNYKNVVSSYHTHFTSYLKYYKLQLLEPLIWKYLTWFYSQCQHIYVPSPAIRKQLEEKGVSGLHIWPRGVDTTLFNPDKRDNAWRRSHHIPKDNCIVSFVSRLVWEKGLKTYARAIDMISKRYDNITALVVGSGPAKDDMQAMLPNAKFTGFLEGVELAKAYANSDIFMFPSDTETFGNVTLEAMASGVPSVVANAGGSNSLIDDGVNGYLAQPGEPKDFAQKAIDIIMHSKHSYAMQEAARKEALNYTWHNINRNLLDCYRRANGKTVNKYA